MKTNRKSMLILLSTLSVAAVLGTVVVSTLFTNAADNVTKVDTNLTGRLPGKMGRGPGGPGMGRRFNTVDVSAEYKQKVIDIAKADPDVQKLLADGYNITVVNPIIKWSVDANGNVAAKATSATLVLHKVLTGKATVHVDLTLSKVTDILISTTTRINK